MVDIAEANEYAKEMVAQHIPGEGYTVTWDRSQGRAGAANYRSREIILSTVAVSHYSWDDLEQLLIHEIAHVKTRGEKESHGKDWRRVARGMGYVGSEYCSAFPQTDRVKITPVGIVAMIVTVYATLQVFGPVWAWIVATVIVAWLVKRALRARRPAALEHGMRMVDGEWVTE